MNTAYAMINLSLAVELMDSKEPIFTPRWLWDDEIAEKSYWCSQSSTTQRCEWIGLQYNEVLTVECSELRLEQRQDGTICECIQLLHSKTHSLGYLIHSLTQPHLLASITFEELIPREMLSEEYGFSDEAEEMCWDISSNVQLNQQARNEKTGYNNVANDTTMVSVINSYSYFEDTLYMVTLNQDASKLLRTVEIKPVFKQEKLECVPMTAVVNVKWHAAKRSDPFGITMLEQVWPKQSAISQLINLDLSMRSSLHLDKCTSMMWTQSRTLTR